MCEHQRFPRHIETFWPCGIVNQEVTGWGPAYGAPIAYSPGIVTGLARQREEPWPFAGSAVSSVPVALIFAWECQRPQGDLVEEAAAAGVLASPSGLQAALGSSEK